MLEFRLGDTDPIVESIMPHPTHIKNHEAWRGETAQQSRQGLVEGQIPYNGKFTSEKIDLTGPLQSVEFSITTLGVALSAHAHITLVRNEDDSNYRYDERIYGNFRKAAMAFSRLKQHDGLEVQLWPKDFPNAIRLIDPELREPAVVVNTIQYSGIRVWIGTAGTYSRKFNDREQFRDHVSSLVGVTQNVVNYIGEYRRPDKVVVSLTKSG